MGKVISQNILDGIVVRFDDIVLFEAITPEQKGSETANKKGRLDAEKYVESLGFKLTDISKESKITADKFGLPFLYVSQEYETETNGISATKDTESLKKNMKKFIILHEYGHLYNFLKDFIEAGTIDY